MWPRSVRRAFDRNVRRVRHRLAPPAAKLVFHRRYAFSVSGLPIDVLKAERILVFLASEGILRRSDVIVPRPVSMHTLRRVHSDAYLDTVHQASAVSAILGTELRDTDVDGVLDLFRLACGGTITAVKIALSRHTVGVNLGGGFHHAGPDRGHGFCLFNDVAAAIAHLREVGFSDRVLVVDLDLHDGDGTRLCFANDPTVHTFSIHNQTWSSAEAIEATSVELGAGVGDETYLATVRELLPRILERFDPELVIYLAGTDPAADDRIGNWKISAAGMVERDRFVLEEIRERRRLPLAVVLAGGYGTDSWRHTARFLTLLLHGEVIEPPPTEEATLQRFRYLSRLLETEDLTGTTEDELTFTAEDLGLGLGIDTVRTKFLDYYSRHGIELALERYGSFEQLRALGFNQAVVSIDLAGADGGDLLRIYADPSRRELLVEVNLRRDRQTIPGMELLAIEWLLLQNPRLHFTKLRPRLPGQQHPGLGLLDQVVSLLLIVCERLGLDGLIFVPGHYHIAVQSRQWLQFLNPEDEQEFQRMMAAVSGRSLFEASWALEEGTVTGPEGAPVKYHPRPMVLPVSARLKARLSTTGRT